MSDDTVIKLSDIFNMVSPATALGVQELKNAAGKVSNNSYIANLLDILYDPRTGGAITTRVLIERLNRFATSKNATPEALNDLKNTFGMFSSIGVPEKAVSETQSVAIDSKGEMITKVTMSDIVTHDVVTAGKKTMAVIMCTAPFLTPAVRNASRIEMFMNFLPPLVATRLVPYLDVEFTFNRASGSDGSSLQPPGLLKFLLGNQDVSQDNTVNTAMFNLRKSRSKSNNGSVESTTSGMEMFTSPQTLVNLSVDRHPGQYVDIIDPMRPLMSLDSFNVTATTTVGLYSYKKATLALKLHDRSRMADIADLVRPQIYQNATTAPTVHVTYGWRHPPDSIAGVETYADFINDNMLVTESYGIINSQFTFEQTGQVAITLELWTKGTSDLRVMSVQSAAGSVSDTLGKIREISERIAKTSQELRLAPAEGVNKEIRGSMLIQAASNGIFPDIPIEDITKLIDSINSTLNNPVGDVKSAANQLIDALKEYYKPEGKNNLYWRGQIKQAAGQVVRSRFEDIVKKPDPFLPTVDKDIKAAAETGAAPHLSAKRTDAKNKQSVNLSEDLSKKLPIQLSNNIVSLGKVMSVFLGDFLGSSSNIDELQLFFYQFNDQAGDAASTNIANFPIDMPFFLDVYRDHVESKGSEELTIEEVLKLLIDSQVDDTRAFGYGFRKYYNEIDPANKNEATAKKGEEFNLENALAGIGSKHGAFKKPSIEVHVETIPAMTSVGGDGSEAPVNIASKVIGDIPSDAITTRVMRIHVFDKTNNPYPTPGSLLRSSDSLPDPAEEYAKEFVQKHANKYNTDDGLWERLLGGKLLVKEKGDIKIALDQQGLFTNQQIKHVVSQMVPTIVYGGNASSVISANLASKQDPLLSTVQQQTIAKKAGKMYVGQPNGAGAFGLPLRIVPASMSMTTLGCPLFAIGQLFFIDFNSGTTLDNIYALTNVAHSMSPGKFESNLTLTFYDGFAKYEGSPVIHKLLELVNENVPEVKT